MCASSCILSRKRCYALALTPLLPQRRESKTKQYDAEAMRYLSYALYPCVIGYAIYALLYESHRGWYSWILNSLVGAVYTFGFILMCPQVPLLTLASPDQKLLLHSTSCAISTMLCEPYYCCSGADRPFGRISICSRVRLCSPYIPPLSAAVHVFLRLVFLDACTHDLSHHCT